MSDIDEDFMCDDEEDYGLVRIRSKFTRLFALIGSRIMATWIFFLSFEPLSITFFFVVVFNAGIFRGK